MLQFNFKPQWNSDDLIFGPSILDYNIIPLNLKKFLQNIDFNNFRPKLKIYL